MHATSYRCGEFEVDFGNRLFSRDGRGLSLEPRVFDVIVQLIRHHDSLVTRNELLDAVWGHRYVTPSTLNRTIGLARRAFGDDAGEPRYILTVHGSGYRYVGPCEPLEQIPASGLGLGPPLSARIPARLDRLIGRDAETTALAAMLAENRAVTVLGPGGIGKTQGAIEVARQVAAQFPNGVWFFDLAPVGSAEQWLGHLAAALSINAVEPQAQISLICGLLQGRRALLVLDNCDRVAVPTGALLVELLRAVDSIKVLATSQAPLDFKGESLFRMPPLRLPDAALLEREDIEQIAAVPAVEMLITRVRAVQPQFSITPINARPLARITLALDGIPLALEFAAARFALLSAEQVLEHLMQRFRFLSSSASGHDARHRSLQSLLDWSFALLSADERRLLCWSAVFVQSWTVDQLIAMATFLGNEAQSVIELLTGLINRSLVNGVLGESPPRYRLLESVREYALDSLRSSGEEDRALDAHLSVIERECAASHHDLLRGNMRNRVEQLIKDKGNIARAIDTAVRSEAGRELGLSILGSLVLFIKAHGGYRTGLEWCRRILSPEKLRETAQEARALLSCGVMQVHTNASGRRQDNVLPQAARIAARHGDWWTEAFACGYHALALANWNRLPEAEEQLTVVRSLAEIHEDDFLRSLAGLAHGWIELARGRHRTALEALLAARDLGHDLHQRHFVDMYIALAQFGSGEYEASAQRWLDGLYLSMAVANLRGMAGSIEGCAYLAVRAMDWTEAARLLAVACRIRELTGSPIFNFWLPYQRDAVSKLRQRLTPADYDRVARDGAQLRFEDAVGEAQALLWRYAGNPERRASQRQVNRPPGS